MHPAADVALLGWGGRGDREPDAANGGDDAAGGVAQDRVAAVAVDRQLDLSGMRAARYELQLADLERDPGLPVPLHRRPERLKGGVEERGVKGVARSIGREVPW